MSATRPWPGRTIRSASKPIPSPKSRRLTCMCARGSRPRSRARVLPACRPGGAGRRRTCRPAGRVERWRVLSAGARLMSAPPTFRTRIWPARIARDGLESLRPHLLRRCAARAADADARRLRSQSRHAAGRPAQLAAGRRAAAHRRSGAEPHVLFTRAHRASGAPCRPGELSRRPRARGRSRRWSKPRCAKRRRKPASRRTSSRSRAFSTPMRPAPALPSCRWSACCAKASRWCPIPNEVDEVFEVPLAFLLDPANRERQEREWQGQRARILRLHPWRPLHLGRDRRDPGQFQRKAGAHDPHRSRAAGSVRAALRAVRALSLAAPAPPAIAACPTRPGSG